MAGVPLSRAHRLESRLPVRPSITGSPRAAAGAEDRALEGRLVDSGQSHVDPSHSATQGQRSSENEAGAREGDLVLGRLLDSAQSARSRAAEAAPSSGRRAPAASERVLLPPLSGGSDRAPDRRSPRSLPGLGPAPRAPLRPIGGRQAPAELYANSGRRRPVAVRIRIRTCFVRRPAPGRFGVEGGPVTYGL